MFRDFDHWKKFFDQPALRRAGRGLPQKSGGNKVVAHHLLRRAPRDLEQGDQQARGHEGPQDPRARRAALHHVPARGRRQPDADRLRRGYLALQNGTVDAQENPLPTIDAKKFYEVQKFIVLTGHITDALAHDRGRADVEQARRRRQEDLRGGAKEAAAKATAEIIEIEKRMAGEFEKKGKTVVRADRKPFREAVMKLHKRPGRHWTRTCTTRLQKL
jgi:TRAP-type C4-dicarboxylate transport system substrate-binding protein